MYKQTIFDKIAMAKFGTSVVVSVLLATAVVYFLTDLKRNQRALFLLGPALGVSLMSNIGYGQCRQAGLINAAAGRTIVGVP